MHGPTNVKNVGLYSEIFKLISTTRLQRNTKIGNSGFVPPVNKHQEDGGLQAEKDGRKELLRTNCKTHVHPRTIWTQGLQQNLNSILTLRRLMSYIYIYMEHLFLMFLDHTQRRSTVGRTPLDE